MIDRELRWVQELILAENTASKCTCDCKATSHRVLPWKGKPIEFVELFYTLHKMRYFEIITLKELFAVAGEIFKLDVKNHHVLLWKLKNNKKGNRTNFLDKMHLALIKEIEKSDDRPSRK